MNRTSVKTLDYLISRLNTKLGRPVTTYTREDGKLRGNIGNFHLQKQLGGYVIHEMHNEAGGVSCPWGYNRCGATEMELRLRLILDTLTVVEQNKALA